MSGSRHGARGAQTLAIAAVAAAVWYVAARSRHVSLAQARAELAGSLAEISAHDSNYGPDAGDPARAMLDLAEREKRLRELSRISGDAARVYESLGVIARSCNVRVERIEPVRTGGRDARPRSTKLRSVQVATESTNYMIEAGGAYADIARFVRALEADLGLTRVVSIRLAPAPITPGEPPLISASIETAHFKVGLPPAPQAPPTEGAR